MSTPKNVNNDEPPSDTRHLMHELIDSSQDIEHQPNIYMEPLKPSNKKIWYIVIGIIVLGGILGLILGLTLRGKALENNEDTEIYSSVYTHFTPHTAKFILKQDDAKLLGPMSGGLKDENGN